MKFSNILFLGLLVLFCLISCSEAGKKSRGLKRGGGGKNGKSRAVGKKESRRKKGAKRRVSKDDDDDDKPSGKKGKKRGNKKNSRKNNKAKRKMNKKKVKKFGKSKGSRRQATEEKSASYSKSEKRKNKGCRHANGGTMGEGHILAHKVSGMAPCWQIHCRADGKKKKWMYEQKQCVSCKVGDVSYAVGYVSDHKCFGGPKDPCYVMMCMQSGQFMKKGYQCGTSPAGTTTSGSNIVYVTVTGTLTNTAWKSGYATSGSSDFNSLQSTIAAKYASAGISGYHSFTLKSAKSGSLIQTGVCGLWNSNCGTSTTCLTNSVLTGAKTFMSSVSAYYGTYTTTSTAATTTVA